MKYNMVRISKIKAAKKNLVALFLLSFILFTAFSFQTNRSTKEKTILWEISDNNLQSPSYLFGTIHLIPKDSFYFPDFMKEKLKNCQVFVTEITLDIPLKEQIMFAQRMMLPNGETFKDYLSEKEYSNFVAFLSDSLGIKPMKINAFVRMKPVFVPGLIINELINRPTAYEIELTKLAKKNKAGFDHLETINEQLDILDSIDMGDAFKYFTSDMDVEGEYYTLLNHYLSGDIHSIYEEIKNDTTFGYYESLLLETRNKKWVTKIDSLIQVRPCFFAVGAGHLPGENGLINLLRNEGYTVKPVANY